MTKTTYFIPALLSFLGLFAFTYTALSQDTESPEPILSKKKRKADFQALKFYFDYKTFNHQSRFDFKSSSIHTIDIQEFQNKGFSTSLGYSKTLKKNRFIELSLSFMGIGSHETNRYYAFPDSSNTTFSTREKIFEMKTGARIEYILPVAKSDDNTNGIYLGVSYEPYIFINKTLPLTFNNGSFSKNFYELNNIIAIVPRFMQNISKNVYLDINIPFPIYSFAVKHVYWENPVLPIYERRKTNTKSTFLPENYQFRIGLGVKI